MAAPDPRWAGDDPAWPHADPGWAAPDSRWVTPTDAPYPARGRIVTPARLVLFVAFLAALAVTVYGVFFERGGLQIPITVSGLGVLGIIFLGMAAWGAATAVRCGRSGSVGRAFLAALFGGLAACGASGSLGGAIVLAFVGRPG